jgi:hypothetical protein
MPRYTVTSGQFRHNGKMIKAGRSFFSDSEGLEKAFVNKLKVVDEPVRLKKKKKSREEDEEIKSSKKKGKKGKNKSKKGKKGKKSRKD